MTSLKSMRTIGLAGLVALSLLAVGCSGAAEKPSPPEAEIEAAAANTAAEPEEPTAEGLSEDGMCLADAFLEQWDEEQLFERYIYAAFEGDGLAQSLEIKKVDMWVSYRCGYPSDFSARAECILNGMIDQIGLEAAASTVWGVVEERRLGAIEMRNLEHAGAECDRQGILAS